MRSGAFHDVLPAMRLVSRDSWSGAIRLEGERTVAEEAAIALTYNRSTHAVMMATPHDLDDLGVGFSLSEGIVDSVDEIEELELIQTEDGIEVRMSLATKSRDAFNRRRRHLTGPTGCGLCGIESLAEAMRPPRRVSSAARFSAAAITSAMAAMPRYQMLHHETHSVHAAAYCQADEGFCGIREDVGRHNALDKLIGALARQSIQPANGIVMVTSRVSVELIQKTAALGAPVIVAVSAPTALAIRACESAGITLAAVARDDRFEVFCHGERIIAA